MCSWGLTTYSQLDKKVVEEGPLWLQRSINHDYQKTIEDCKSKHRNLSIA